MIDPISSGLIGFVVGGVFSRAPHWRAKYVKAEYRARCLAAENQGLALKLVEVGGALEAETVRADAWFRHWQRADRDFLTLRTWKAKVLAGLNRTTEARKAKAAERDALATQARLEAA